MDRLFEARKRELMGECVVNVAELEGMEQRLRQFVQPFAACLAVREQQEYAQDYVVGLTSNLERKNVESIAYLHNQDRQGLQRFIGSVSWDHKPLLRLLATQVGLELGEPDGVIVFDPSGFQKKGKASVGVQRQWLGRLGKVDNGQVGVYMAYASRKEHALVDERLYLPKSWAQNRKRCKACGVPAAEIQYRTRHALALEMLADQGSLLPHAWIAGDDEMGRSSIFRKDLRDLHEQYLLAVPSNTRVRDLDGPTAPYEGRGPHPKPKWTRVDGLSAALAEDAWETIDVRDGEKGPLVVEGAKARVEAKAEKGHVGPQETFVVLRSRDEEGQTKIDYYLSNAPFDTPLSEFARVAKAEHRIEDSLQRAKGEAGLADYEVRTWKGWHHHQTLSLLATWFLVQETRREKNPDSRNHRPPSPHHPGPIVPGRLDGQHARRYRPRLRTSPATEGIRQALPLEKTQPIAAIAGTATVLA